LKKSEGFLKLFYAIHAYSFIVEINYIVGLVAKNAGRLIFLENYFIVVGKYFKIVCLFNVEKLACLHGDYDSSKRVGSADYSG
jgi:hypothetical protein